jgi:hypothetical protein
MIPSKYTLVEFIAALESDDFDQLDETWVGWAKDFLSHLNSNLVSGHNGDCTNQPSPCYLCVVENMLKNYREYCLSEEQWRKNNL